MVDTLIWGWLQPGALPGFSLSNQDNLGPGLNGTVVTTAGYTEYYLRDLDGDGIVHDSDTDDGSAPAPGEGIVFGSTLSNAHEIAVYENSTITVNGVDTLVRLVVTVTDNGTWGVRILDADIQPGWYPADITAAKLGTFFPTEYSGTNVSSVDQMLCFGPETPIFTPGGFRRADSLCRGDRVMTAGRRFVPLIWTARSTGPALEERGAPILLDAGVLGLRVPIRLSPQHRVLIASPEASLLFGTRKVLVAARHLLALDGVVRMPQPSITYVHLMTRRHTVLRTPGLWCESFLPGDRVLDALLPQAHRAMRDSLGGCEIAPAPYRSLSGAEAAVLLQAMARRSGPRPRRGRVAPPAQVLLSAPSPAQSHSDAQA